MNLRMRVSQAYGKLSSIPTVCTRWKVKPELHPRTYDSKT